jgi:hypothetical protein
MQLISNYFLSNLPYMSDKTRGGIISSFTQEGAIIIIDLPIKQWDMIRSFNPRYAPAVQSQSISRKISMVSDNRNRMIPQEPCWAICAPRYLISMIIVTPIIGQSNLLAKLCIYGAIGGGEYRHQPE